MNDREQDVYRAALAAQTLDEVRIVAGGARMLDEYFDLVDGQLAIALRLLLPKRARVAVTQARAGLTRLRELIVPEHRIAASLAAIELARRESKLSPADRNHANG